jgi:hypothetical protein
MRRVEQSAEVNSFTFFLFLCFLIDFFLHLSARVPGLAVIRPTLLLVGLIGISLFLQRDRLKLQAKDPIFGAMIALVVYIIVSIPVVEFQGSVLRGNLMDFVKAAVFFFFTAYITTGEKRLRIVVGFFVACQLFRVLEPLYLHVTTGYWGGATFVSAGEFAGRLAGAPSDVINPNELGFVIATVIPFLHYMYFPSSSWSRLVYIVILPLLLYALILTMSRGAVIALVVVAWMVFKESRHKIGLVFIGIVMLIAAWNVMSPLQKDRYLSLVSSDAAGAATVEGRKEGMISEFKLGFGRPVFGHGVGTTPEAKYHRYGKTQASHNFYAELLIEIGLLGFIFFFRYIKCLYERFSLNLNSIKNMSLDNNHYYLRLNKVLIAVFWMYVVYSMNYWGLSVYYWYFFGGLVIAFGRIIDKAVESEALNNKLDNDRTIKAGV